MHPGEVVDERFEIQRSAGSGGMGVVYRARDRATGNDVALKVLLEPKEGLTERFAEEAEHLSALEHPHIVGYVAHGTTAAGAPYLVMPWLEGHDLQQRLREGPLSVEETLALARAVAGALAHLHARGLVHRDLKPSNLFLVGGALDAVTLIDLGIARATVPARPLTLSGTLLGTPGFIAPEQALGDREVAPAVDVFALGCVLFECLTGQRLFDGSHVMAVLAKILVQEPPRVRELRPDVPDALDLLIHRMVAKDPDRRPRDGAQVAHWLEDIHRVPPDADEPPPLSLTGSEQRVVSVLVVVLSPPPASPGGPSDVTKAELDPFRASAARFGVRMQPLDVRTAIVLAPDALPAADQASVLARFGRHVAETYPDASVALATGSAVTGARLPVGDAIDRGVSIVRAAAPGNGVHVDDVSAALITSRFDLRREGERVLLADERLSLDPTRPLLGRPTSCVGRDREFAILDAIFGEAQIGAPSVVLVTAAAGAGKSRLRHEFVRRLRASSPTMHRVLQCNGDPLHVATPYAQVAQIVRQAAELGRRDAPDIVRAKLEAHVRQRLAPADVARVTDFLAELVGTSLDDGGHLALRAARHSAEAMADQIGSAFEDILRAWCKECPIVLVLEDLHWADAGSIKLVDDALRRLHGSALFVLALARPDVHERFPSLWKSRDLTQIRLPQIPQRACAKLVREVLGDDAPPEEVARIVERSEGNGFYLEELIRDAAARLWANASPSRPPPARGDELPESVIAAGQARLERLEPRARKVLRAASIYGEAFPIDGVSALLGEDRAALEPVFAALVEHETVATSERPRRSETRDLVFRHALLRSAAYATLTDEDRVLGHRLAAQWLDGAGEDREVVAMHWLEGGDRERAAVCFAQAAEVRWAHAQADAAARCAVRSLLVGSASAAGPSVVAERLRLLAEALEAARRIDGGDVLAGLERHVAPPPEGTGGIAPPGTVVHVVLARVLDEIRASDETPTVIEALLRAARALGALSDLDPAKRLLLEATSLAADNELRMQRVRYASAKIAFWAYDFSAVVEALSATLLPSDPRERLEMLLILATAVVSIDGADALPRGLEYVQRAEVLLETLPEDPVAQVHCCKARLLCFSFAGEHALAAKVAETAVELSHRVGLRYEECANLYNLGLQYAHLGERGRARTALDGSNHIARDLGFERLRLHNEPLLAFFEGNQARLMQLADEYGAVNNLFHEMYARYWLSNLLATQGAPEASRELSRALELARTLKVRALAEHCTKLMRGLSHPS